MIELNASNLSERVAALKNAANNSDEQTLYPIDDESTMSVNQNSQSSFQASQEGLTILSDALEMSAIQIQEIGNNFFDIDRQAATNWQSNVRT